MSDLIDRQAAISAICNACGKIDCDKMDKCEKLQLPPAQPEPKRERRKIGEWIYDWGDWDFETCKCSECGNHMTTPIGKRYSFCPNCGAKMEVTE